MQCEEVIELYDDFRDLALTDNEESQLITHLVCGISFFFSGKNAP